MVSSAGRRHTDAVDSRIIREEDQAAVGTVIVEDPTHDPEHHATDNNYDVDDPVEGELARTIVEESAAGDTPDNIFGLGGSHASLKGSFVGSHNHLGLDQNDILKQSF